MILFFLFIDTYISFFFLDFMYPYNSDSGGYYGSC